MQAQVDLAHERGREGTARLHPDALLGCGQLGGCALDELGSFGLRQIAERPEHGQQRPGAGEHRRGTRGEALSLLEDLGGDTDAARSARGQVVRGDRDRVRPPGGGDQGACGHGEQVAAVGVARDFPARIDGGYPLASRSGLDRRRGGKRAGQGAPR